jgi:hypothetical protein
MVSKEEAGRRIRQFGQSRFKTMAEFRRALGFKSDQHLYCYLRGESYPGFELLDKLRRLGCNIDDLMRDEGAAALAEQKAEYGTGKEIRYKSDAEKREVEAAVEALVDVAASYFQFAEPATVKTLKQILTEEELKRHRRREMVKQKKEG